MIEYELAMMEEDLDMLEDDHISWPNPALEGIEVTGVGIGGVCESILRKYS
jgi:hypothetical protein